MAWSPKSAAALINQRDDTNAWRKPPGRLLFTTTTRSAWRMFFLENPSRRKRKGMAENDSQESKRIYLCNGGGLISLSSYMLFFSEQRDFVFQWTTEFRFLIAKNNFGHIRWQLPLYLNLDVSRQDGEFVFFKPRILKQMRSFQYFIVSHAGARTRDRWLRSMTP